MTSSRSERILRRLALLLAPVLLLQPTGCMVDSAGVFAGFATSIAATWISSVVNGALNVM